MRKYFERVEKCLYAPAGSASRHGAHGWLPTDIASPLLAARDGQLLSIIEAAAEEAAELRPNLFGDAILAAVDPTRALFDPNDYRSVRANAEGLFFVPLSVSHGARVGTREYVKKVAAACPDRLVVLLDSLATRVVFDADRRATGVEIVKGARLYRAAPGSESGAALGPREIVRAKREVILAGGVFNTPQLLMLSGVGPRDALEAQGIDVVSDLSGVGQNLQDRYEIGVVSEMVDDFAVLEGANLPRATEGVVDRELARWQRDGTGPYSSNGIVSALIKKSRPELTVPDLFLFGLVGRFHGYYPGYSKELVASKRHFTWGVLKAHTQNRAGEVRLRSPDPRDRPDIHFRYFQEGSPGHEDDLRAVVEGVETVRRIMRSAGDCVAGEIIPGPSVATREQIANYVRAHAWGHHASCSNKMGAASDPTAVVDSRFRVRGTRGLRVVDASVFPRIPGFFIVSSVYMLAEKASDAILEDARARG
jgi:choline dehydrogenase